MSPPTPGAPNAKTHEVLAQQVADIQFSVQRGLYQAAQTVEISTTTENAQILVTTDGTAPRPDNPSAVQYTGPLSITTTTIVRAAAYKPGLLPTNTHTHSYLFLDAVLKQDQQTALAAGFPSRWGDIEPDYAMDQRVVQAAGAAALTNSLRSLPTVSLAASDLFGPQGIYTQSIQQGAAFERPASAEWIFADQRKSCQIHCGVRIQGGISRIHEMTKKHSFRLLFKGIYGASPRV
jgi:hypothetical protein